MYKSYEVYLVQSLDLAYLSHSNYVEDLDNDKENPKKESYARKLQAAEIKIDFGDKSEETLWHRKYNLISVCIYGMNEQAASKFANKKLFLEKPENLYDVMDDVHIEIAGRLSSFATVVSYKENQENYQAMKERMDFMEAREMLLESPNDIFLGPLLGYGIENRALEKMSELRYKLAEIHQDGRFIAEPVELQKLSKRIYPI